MLLSENISAQDKIQIKVGIFQKIGEESIRLKSKDRLKINDEFRIYISPLEAVYVYAIFSDQKSSYLLNAEETKSVWKKDQLVALPSDSEYYQIDTGTEKCKVTIICSKNKLNSLVKLFSSENVAERKKWDIEEKKYKTDDLDLNDSSDKPFVIAGNVRGEESEILNKLQLVKGKSTLIKTYEFEIKK